MKRKRKSKNLHMRLLPFFCCLLLMGCAPSGGAASQAEQKLQSGKSDIGTDTAQVQPDSPESTGWSTDGVSADEAVKTEKIRENTPEVLVPSADGREVYKSEEVCIDASNLSEGYVMIKYTGSADKARLLLDTPAGDTYNYRLPLDETYTVIPLSDGSGCYGIGIYENIVDDKYAEIFSQEVTAQITDENKTFLYPNQYVNFDASCQAVQKGSELAEGKADELEVVTAVYEYVTQHVTYDYDKAETVQSGYLPDVDETLSGGRGICFDYAALMAAMLRSQRIPTRLEIGYADTVYHAWVSVYIEDEGWIEDMIYFDGETWRLLDPTLASYAKEKTIRKHMEESDNYYEIKYKY